MKISKIVLTAVILTILGFNPANAQSLGDLLQGDLGTTIGNAIEGVFTSSKISVADMEGKWTSTGPAVTFQGEGFLKQAGGVAAAATIEAKLAPYYTQYGLDGAVFTVEKDGTFTLKLKKGTLKGKITKSAKGGDGVFDASFTMLGMKLLTLTTYVQKTSTTMDVMFDATKFKKLISAVGNLTGMTLAKTLATVLDSYDGMCVGFHFKGGNPNAESSTAKSVSKGVDLLKDVLKGKSSK